MPNYEVEYISMLETAFNFLFRKGKPVNGSPLNQARQDFVMTCGGCCLHCGKKLTHYNSNTEHIHDRALGGLNKASNKIIICTSCNLARNKTMQMYLGAPSYWRGFPGNWDRVKKYLLWNAVTVDKGHNLGKNYPDVHELFESIMAESNNNFSPPNTWYGRGEHTILIRTESRNKNRFWIRFFDKIFGYESTNQSYEPNHKNTEDIESNDKSQSDNIVKSKRKILDLDKKFYEHILSAINSVEGEIKLETFGTYFQLYLVGNGLARQSLKEFAKSHGIPKRRTFIQTIEDYFPNEIQYRREGATIVYISKKNRDVFVSRIDEEE